MVNRMVLNPQAFLGKGAVKSIIDIIKSQGYKKAFIVTDKVLVKYHVVKKITDILEKENIPYHLFDETKQNPTVINVKDGILACKESEADFIIAIGGGSSIDCAKAIGIIMKNPEFSDVLSLEGTAPTKHKGMSTIAIPTTAGTAAEVTINYVLTDEERKRKFVCIDTNDIPNFAIVDCELMISMPPSLTAATGMDALTHAIEGYITKAAWVMTDMLHIKAIEIIAKNLRMAVLEKNIDAFENMSYAQYIAGMGFSNVGLGIVHSMAHPLGAFYNIPHGVANAVLLPYVMEYNASSTGTRYRDIAIAMGISSIDNMTESEYQVAAIQAVKELSKDVGIPSTLKEIGVKEEDFSFLAESAFDDVCTGGNPKKSSVVDIYALYKYAYEGAVKLGSI